MEAAGGIYDLFLNIFWMAAVEYDLGRSRAKGND